MMQKLAILVLFFSTIICAQQLKFAVINSPHISESKSAAILDSAVSAINRNSEINFVLVTGSLTNTGNILEADQFKESISKLSKQVFILQSATDIRDANSWQSLNEFSDDKFIHETNNILFIGLSPVVPLTKLNYYSLENLEWLTSVFDTIKIDKEFIFISPLRIDGNINNLENVLSLLYKKYPQLIINWDAEKPLLHNLNGHYIFDVPSLSLAKDKTPVYFLISVQKDSIIVFDSSDKMFAAVDKTVRIEKDNVVIPEVQTFNSDIIMLTDLNSTMITSTSYWNGKIYIADRSGLISCIDSTGKVLWDYDGGGNIFSKPVIADRVLTFATYQGELNTISAISGEQIQSIGFEATITSDLSIIDFEGKQELMVPKLSESKSAIVFGTAEGKVFCYDLETLQQYWVNENAGGMVRSKPVSSQNKILFSSRDGYLYCIDSRDGLLIWRWKEKAGTDLSDSPIYCDVKKVFVVSGEGNVYAVNLMLGKLEWKLEKLNATTNFGISNNDLLLYLFSRNGSFYTIDAGKGSVVKEIKSAGIFSESLDYPVEAGENIFYSAGGTVFRTTGKNPPDKIIFTGSSPSHTLINISNNKFLASNVDGQIIIFTLR